MTSSEYNRVNYFIKQATAIWGHKISQEFKSHENISKLCSEWTKATQNLTDYQFKTACRESRDKLSQFPSIAEFINLAPDHVDEKNNSNLTTEEIYNAKETMKELIKKRNEVLLKKDLDNKSKYTFMRAVDEQICKHCVRLRNSGIPENLIP